MFLTLATVRLSIRNEDPSSKASNAFRAYYPARAHAQVKVKRLVCMSVVVVVCAKIATLGDLAT